MADDKKLESADRATTTKPCRADFGARPAYPGPLGPLLHLLFAYPSPLAVPYVFHPLETNSMPEEQEKKDVVNATEHGKDSGLETDSIQEVLRAAGASTEADNPNVPCLTLRMWIIGIGFCVFGSGLNTLYTLRKPSITLSQTVVQLLAYPLGKLWEKGVPDWCFRLCGWSFSLNPGPFNHKENILIFIMANLSFLSRLSADVLTEQQAFYGYDAGWGFQILICLATFLIGFSLAGLFRSIIVEPQNMVWPGVLGVTALNKVLHSGRNKEDITNGRTWNMSQYTFFTLAFCASFVWYWFPDFIMTCLSYFTFPCWIAPTNTVVNQVFGMTSGMGLLPLTFDWSQIAYIGSPLLVPTWAIVNVTISIAIWIWIVATGLYYSNVWFTAYLPFQSSSVFDNQGKKYSVSKVINKASDFQFDSAAYEAYSPVYMPITYALNTFGLSFATLSSLIVWMFLEQHEFLVAAIPRLRAAIFRPFRSERHFSSTSSQSYHDVPLWWYIASSLVAVFLSIFAVEYWHVQLRWYGVLLALAVTLVFFVPLSVVYATSNIKISIDIFCRIVAGFAFPGKVLANIWFFNLGYISVIKGLGFAQDLKLGIYCNIPARHVFLVQVVGMIFGSLSYVGVINWALNHIPGICTNDAINGFTCPFPRTHFNTSMIWGAIGPRRFFNSSTGYYSLLYFFVIGAVLPIPVYFLRHRYPNSFWRRVHVPLFLGCLNFLPPASGTNYGSWAIVGLVSSFFLRRRTWAWWQKYNFVLSSALDCSVSIAGVIIFFAIFYSGASSNLEWWGTQVHKDTCDAKGCPYLSLGEGETFG